MLIFSKGHNPEREITRTRKKIRVSYFPWGIHIWNFKTLACTVRKIWHASDFVWIFQRGITPERETTRTRKKNVSNIFPWGIHIWNFKTLACMVLERTKGWTHNPKPICPVNFFEVGGIKKHNNLDASDRKLLFRMDGGLPPAAVPDDPITQTRWWHSPEKIKSVAKPPW